MSLRAGLLVVSVSAALASAGSVGVRAQEGGPVSPAVSTADSSLDSTSVDTLDAALPDPAAADSTSAASEDSLAGPTPVRGLGGLGAAARAAADSDTTAAAAADTLSGAEDAGAAAAASGLAGTGRDAARSRPGGGGDFAPKFEGSVNSSVSRVQLRGSAEADVGSLVGTRSTVRYVATDTSYRQQDRDQEQRDLTANLREEFGDLATLTVDFSRNSSYDENRVGTGAVVLEYTNTNARLKLDGGGALAEGFRHHWAARGDFEDAQQTNRGVDNDRNLAGAAITSVWSRRGDELDVTARYGYERSSGERTVRGLVDDASAERDTLEARAVVDAIPRLNLDLGAIRTSFVEQRLDFARNSSGVVDTVSTSGPKVARERESTRGYEFEARANSRILPRLRLTGSGSVQYSETEYTFSQQGFVERGNDRVQSDATFRYAEAGSLRVAYSFSDRYNDRRTRNDTEFRGRESNRSYSAEFELDQALLARSSVEFKAKQTLDQSIFEEQGNQNDRDRLFERFDLELSSEVVPHTKVEVGGTISRTEDLQIAADRVGDNKEERLIEVRGSYAFDPPGGLRMAQTYRLQIRYIDFFLSDDRDQFNKQGQLNTTVDYELPLGADFGGEYVLDFRRTGTRNTAIPYREVYFRDQKRFDHRLTARIGVPFRGLRLDVRTERGFLREERGTRETNEDRGSISARLSGTRSFWSNRATLKLDLERVLQFGPRIREEQEDYWVANTTLTLAF